MRRRIICICIIVVVIGIIFNIFFPKVHITQDKARLIYCVHDKKVNVLLNDKETQLIKEIFNGKRLYFDEPSCGFDKNVSIKFGNQYFCVAWDDCGTVQVDKKYISISDSNKKKIIKIFEKYGGAFHPF